MTSSKYCVAALIAINVVVFVAMLIVCGSKALWEPDKTVLLQWQANLGAITAQGEYWRLLTSIFVHAGLLHIGFNMYALWTIGVPVCSKFGWAKFLTIYLLSGLAGALATMVWNPTQISVGASGAIFGVCGALLTVLMNKRDSSAEENSWLSVPPMVFGAFIVGSLVYGLINPAMDTGSHVGGFCAGFLIAWILNSKQATASKLRTFASVSVIGLIFLLAVPFSIWKVNSDKRMVIYKMDSRAMKELQNDKFADALVLYEKLLSVDSSASHYIGKAAALTGLAKYDDALLACDQAIAIDPKDQAGRFAKAWNLHFVGKDKEAIQELSEVIAADPKHSGAYNSRAWSRLVIGEYDQAVADASRAIAISPEAASYYDTRGLAYYFLGHYDQALADFAKGIKIDRREASCYFHRALVYTKLGQTEKADQDRLIAKNLEYEPEQWEVRQ
ncbi:MAG: rhomboid family intramembrane serine protease [Candidatus Obscuribacterales bacterium]|nr:rhomboid family intramembrane serine protease [Candidatus Obscuribacterales bacterium]